MNTNNPSSKSFLKATAFKNDLDEGITYLITTPSTVTVIPSQSTYYSSSITIPETVCYKGVDYVVNKIGDSAFANNYNLTSIAIPSTICVVEENAFANNLYLTQVISNVTTPLILPKTVFSYTSRTRKLIVPTASLAAYKTADIWKNFDSITDVLPIIIAGIVYEKTSETTVKVLENYDNSYSGSVTIPASIDYNDVNYHVTEISETAFKDNQNITTISIGHYITTIEAYTFSNCKNLKSITLPNSVTYIGESAFSYSGLTSFIFPNSMTTIENYLFISCEELITVKIPNTIITIKEYSFGWCTKLTNLYCTIESPLMIPLNVFFGTDINACVLYVPVRGVETYKVTNIWKNFRSIIVNKSHDTSGGCS